MGAEGKSYLSGGTCGKQRAPGIREAGRWIAESCPQDGGAGAQDAGHDLGSLTSRIQGAPACLGMPGQVLSNELQCQSISIVNYVSTAQKNSGQRGRDHGGSCSEVLSHLLRVGCPSQSPWPLDEACDYSHL